MAHRQAYAEAVATSYAIPFAPLCDVLTVDKIASSTALLPLSSQVQVIPELPFPCAGDVVAVRVLSENPAYNLIELAQGRQARLTAGDIMLGVIGARRALRGFVGEVPTSLQKGDRLHLLNMGGVIGHCTGAHNDLGKAIELEFLGVVSDGERGISIKQGAIKPQIILFAGAPVIAVAGTCMHSGKTQAATELIKHLARKGLRVAAAKLSGVACLRDTLNMQDHGAFSTLSFHDCGLPSTVDVLDLAPYAKALLNTLNLKKPEVIVVELGDGIIGGYNVDSLLSDNQLKKAFSAVVFCASDFVGAWGGVELLKKKGITIDAITGSCTDSAMGIKFIDETLQIPAANALHAGHQLFQLIATKIGLCAEVSK